MLGQGSGWAGSAVFERYYGDSQGIEVSADGRNFEVVRIVACVASSGIDYLDCVGLELMGEVPFDVGFALILLAVRHLAFRPNGFFLIACAVLIGCVAVHNLLLGLHGA